MNCGVCLKNELDRWIISLMFWQRDAATLIVPLISEEELKNFHFFFSWKNINFVSIHWQRRPQLLLFLICVQQQHKLAHSFSTDRTIYSVATVALATKRKNCTNASWIQMDFVDVHLNGIELRSNRGSSLWFYYSSYFDGGGGIWISFITPEISGRTNWGHHQPDECRSICQFAARWMWWAGETEIVCHQFWLESVSYKFVPF